MVQKIGFYVPTIPRQVYSLIQCCILAHEITNYCIGLCEIEIVLNWNY